MNKVGINGTYEVKESSAGFSIHQCYSDGSSVRKSLYYETRDMAQAIATEWEDGRKEEQERLWEQGMDHG